MKLLIVTQVVDETHPVLGFFHRWIEEFALHCEQVTVICLEEGRHQLPQNVKVLSLGKETGNSKFSQLKNFFQYIWQERHNYDHVFVHMNQIYVLLGGLLWRLPGKKVGLWYMHGSTPVSLRFAIPFTNYIFTGSKESFRLKSKKLILSGHGIEMREVPEVEKDWDVITIGRLSRAKNLHSLIVAIAPLLREKNYTLHIIGGGVTREDKQYETELKELIETEGLNDKVIFNGPVPHSDLPALRARAKVFVTTAQNGSLDKAMLEAMASGLPLVSMAPGSASLPLGTHQVNSTAELREAVAEVLESGNYYKTDYVSYIKQNHSLSRLIKLIVERYE